MATDMATDINRAAAAQTASKRLVIAGPSARSLKTLRGALMADVVSRRHQVWALTQDAREPDVLALSDRGVSVSQIKMQPDGFSLWPARIVLQGLTAQLAEIQPHVVLVYGASLVPLAVRAAQRAGVPRIAVLLSELDNGALSAPLRRALRSTHVIVAHNREDFRAVVAAKLRDKRRIVLQLPGAGADLAAFDGLTLPPLEPEIIFVMAARLDKAKGVLEFCQAARQLKSEGAAAKFVVAGEAGTGPDAISPETLAQFDGAITRTGHVDGLKPILAAAHVFVAPSHREGMPHAVLQALAAGRLCIVTDIPGNRETVDEMVNGLLVPPGDAAELAEAFRRVLKRPELIALMGRASRLKAERHFSQISVNARLMTALELP